MQFASGQGETTSLQVDLDVTDPAIATQIVSSRCQLIVFPTVHCVAVAIFCTALQVACRSAGGVIAHQLVRIRLQRISGRTIHRAAVASPVTTSRLIIFEVALNTFASQNRCQCFQRVASNALQGVAPGLLVATNVPVFVRASPARAVDVNGILFDQVARWTSKRVASSRFRAADAGRSKLTLCIWAEQLMRVWP